MTEDLKLQALVRAARVLRVSERMGAVSEEARKLGDTENYLHYGAIHHMLLQKIPELLGFSDGLIPAETLQAVLAVNTAKKCESAVHTLKAQYLWVLQLKETMFKERQVADTVENTKDAPHEPDVTGMRRITRSNITYSSIRQSGVKAIKILSYCMMGLGVVHEARASYKSAEHKILRRVQLEKATGALEDYLTLAEMVREVPNEGNSIKISAADTHFINRLATDVMLLRRALLEENSNGLSKSVAEDSSGLTAAEQLSREEYYKPKYFHKDVMNNPKMHQLDARGEQILFMFNKILDEAAVFNGVCVDEVMGHPHTDTHQKLLKITQEMLENLLRDVKIEQSAYRANYVRASADAIVFLERIWLVMWRTREELDRLDLEILYKNTTASNLTK